MRILVVALAVLALAVTPVFASQCPSLIKQVNDAVSGGTPLEQEDLYNEEIYENYLEHGDTP